MPKTTKTKPATTKTTAARARYAAMTDEQLHKLTSGIHGRYNLATREAAHAEIQRRERAAAAPATTTPAVSPADEGIQAARADAREARELDALLLAIAKEHIARDIETLETRRSGSLDFYDCAVWGIRAALQAAYEAGRNAK